MSRYILAKEKLRKYVKLITLEDHRWHLRSLDHNFVGVVKVHCVGCYKEFGSTTRDHSKNTIHNILAKKKYKQNHLIQMYIFEIGAIYVKKIKI